MPFPYLPEDDHFSPPTSRYIASLMSVSVWPIDLEMHIYNCSADHRRYGNIMWYRVRVQRNGLSMYKTHWNTYKEAYDSGYTYITRLMLKVARNGINHSM